MKQPTLTIYKLCPVCGKRMIKRYADIVYDTMPPMHPWFWWCGCGHEEAGGTERVKTADELAMDQWRAANDMDTLGINGTNGRMIWYNVLFGKRGRTMIAPPDTAPLLTAGSRTPEVRGMKIVYVRGGDKTAPMIAEACGMVYGTRHDYTPYAPVYLLDINWHSFNWSDYLDKVRAYRPVMAMTPDYESPRQRRTLYACIRDLKPLVQQVMVCPKFPGAVEHIPSWCVVAVSVPTTYAGFLPDFRSLPGRKIHLLGGKPETQADLIRKLNGAGAEVVSVDGSYHAMKAGFGQWFQDGQWVQLRRNAVSDTDLCIASGKNIVRYLQAASQQTQHSLFNMEAA